MFYNYKVRKRRKGMDNKALNYLKLNPYLNTLIIIYLIVNYCKRLQIKVAILRMQKKVQDLDLLIVNMIKIKNKIMR